MRKQSGLSGHERGPLMGTLWGWWGCVDLGAAALAGPHSYRAGHPTVTWGNTGILECSGPAMEHPPYTTVLQ